jgi:hypothetical protein
VNELEVFGENAVAHFDGRGSNPCYREELARQNGDRIVHTGARAPEDNDSRVGNRDGTVAKGRQSHRRWAEFVHQGPQHDCAQRFWIVRSQSEIGKHRAVRILAAKEE